MSKRASNLPDFLRALIRTAYLPKELPPIITSTSFSDFCKKEYKTLKTHQDKLTKSSTQYATFTIPRTTGGRRALALVHPNAQLGVSLIICSHRKPIKDTISANGVSLYDVQEDKDADKAFVGLDFNKRPIRAAKIYSDFTYVVEADISRFFYTIYTHSLPWAVVGKTKVKQWLADNRNKLNRHWSSQFDFAIQSCQSRETFGIPVGPDTSRIFAELLLAGIEKDEELAPHLIHERAFRLLDDFAIGAESEAEAQSVFSALKRALWKFNLQLNDGKSAVRPSYKLYRERWKLDFEAVRVSDLNPVDQRSDIYRLVELTLHFCDEAGSTAPASWACRRLLSLENIEDNFSIILDALLRLARDFPTCVSHVAEFLINNQTRCRSSEAKSRIRRWVKAMLDAHLAQRDDFEVAWCLVVCGVLRIRLDETDFSKADIRPSSVVLSIIGMLRERAIIQMPLSKWNWRADFTVSGVHSENWLFIYEAVCRKWTTDKNLVKSVTQDYILGKMHSAGVTFLDDKILDAAKINVVRRKFMSRTSPTGIDIDVADIEDAGFELDDYFGR